MDEFIPLRAGQWRLTLAPKALSPSILSFVGRLVIDHPVLVLDGGNQFNAFEIANAIRGDEEILEKIQARVLLPVIRWRLYLKRL